MSLKKTIKEQNEIIKKFNEDRLNALTELEKSYNDASESYIESGLRYGTNENIADDSSLLLFELEEARLMETLPLVVVQKEYTYQEVVVRRSGFMGVIAGFFCGIARFFGSSCGTEMKKVEDKNAMVESFNNQIKNIKMKMTELNDNTEYLNELYENFIEEGNERIEKKNKRIEKENEMQIILNEEAKEEMIKEVRPTIEKHDEVVDQIIDDMDVNNVIDSRLINSNDDKAVNITLAYYQHLFRHTFQKTIPFVKIPKSQKMVMSRMRTDTRIKVYGELGMLSEVELVRSQPNKRIYPVANNCRAVPEKKCAKRYMSSRLRDICDVLRPKVYMVPVKRPVLWNFDTLQDLVEKSKGLLTPSVSNSNSPVIMNYKKFNIFNNKRLSA